jgi:hypothetical protein
MLCNIVVSFPSACTLLDWSFHYPVCKPPLGRLPQGESVAGGAPSTGVPQDVAGDHGL